MTFSGHAPPGRMIAPGVLLAIYLLGVGTLHFAPEQSVAPWWPAAGLSVTLLALAPRPWWPLLAAGVVVASGLANLTGGRSIEVSALFGVANATEALVAAGLLTRGGTNRPRLQTLDEFLRLVSAALLGAVTAATMAATTVAVLHHGSFAEAWRSAVTSHAAATLLIAPVALTLRGQVRRGRASEIAVQSLALLLVTLAAFSPMQDLPIAFAPLPLLVWAALRFDVRTVTWQLLAMAVLCTVLTTRGTGPFGATLAASGLSSADGGALLQLFLVSATLMALPLTVVVEQRRDLLAQVTARELLFRRNFTESLFGMLLLQRRGDRLEIVDANQSAVELFGTPHDELVGRYLDRLLASPSAVRSITQSILAGELDGWHTQTGLHGRPSARVNIAVSLLSSGDKPVFSAQVLDVTAEHHARTRIEAAEKLTNAMLDTAACLILVTDLAGTVVRVNAATVNLTGFREDQLVGRPVWAEIVPAYRVGALRQMFAGGDGSGVVGTREADVATADGRTLRVVWNSNLVADEDGNPAYAVLTGIDVTAERTTSGWMTHLLQAAITTALIGIDTAGRITAFNSGAQHLLGLTADEVFGRPFVELLDPDELATRTAGHQSASAFEALTASVRETGESPERDWSWIGAGGRRRTVSMTLSIASDSFAAQGGFLCVGRDVTEQRHSQEMLVAALEKERTAVQRLRELDSAKNEFVSTVSHELRTPVTSIVGYTEMLKDGSVVDPHPTQLPLLATIARNGARLIEICNDLLLLEELDRGTAPAGRDAVDLRLLLHNVEESMQPLMRGRDLEVSFELPDQSIDVLGDSGQLERAVLNLLSNAVKFTEEGGRIGCRLERHRSEAWVVVHDTGIGIPAEEQAGLFEKFFRSSSTQQRAIQGAGLGLSIVAGIVAGHGGRVGVDSVDGSGTTFTIQLPLHRT